MKQKQDHRHRKQTQWLPRGEGDEEGMEWEAGVSRCKLLYIERINNKVLLQSTEDYILYPMINHNEKMIF